MAELTRDDVMAMAKEAGIYPANSETISMLCRFAKLAAAKVRADEREECAKLCDSIAHDRERRYGRHYRITADECAHDIRARGNS